MSLKKYKTTDLTIFAVIVVALEALNLLALKRFSGEMFTVSVTLAVTLIVMMRWGAFGLIHAFLGGLAYVYISGQTGETVGLQQYLMYCAGNLLVGLDLIVMKLIGKERLRANAGWIVVYTACGFVFLNLGRALMSLFFTAEFFPVLTRLYTTDALNALITFIIVWVASKQNGVFEDQIHYLQRIAAEKKDGEKS